MLFNCYCFICNWVIANRVHLTLCLLYVLKCTTGCYHGLFIIILFLCIFTSFCVDFAPGVAYGSHVEICHRSHVILLVVNTRAAEATSFSSLLVFAARPSVGSG